jgi:hypothetical protein
MFKYPGTWWVYSEKDPRWNKTGHVAHLSMGTTPRQAQDAIDELKKKYGKIPSDLTISYDKD